MLSLQASKSAVWDAVPDAASDVGPIKPHLFVHQAQTKDVVKEPETNLLLDVSGVEPCMFGQAGQDYHVLQLLQLLMHVYRICYKCRLDCLYASKSDAVSTQLHQGQEAW